MTAGDRDQPRDRARRRLLKMGAYTPAVLVSLTAISRTAEAAAPTTAVGTVVSLKTNATAEVKSFTEVKAQSQATSKAKTG